MILESRHALRSAKPIQLFRLGYCPTLDTMLRVFELLVQNSDYVWLGLMRLKGGVGGTVGSKGRGIWLVAVC